MRFNSLPTTVTAILLAVVVAGCAKKQLDDSSTTATKPAAANTETAAPVTTNDQVQATDTGVTVAAATAPGSNAIDTAEGFESNPANYTGDVRTRVIYFAFDSSDVPSAAYATLKAHAKVLAASSLVRLKLEGNTDERGTPEYNVALGERRANAVKKFLVLNGASEKQIEVVSYGEEKPADLGHDELAMAKNRRAELVYTAGKP